MHIIAHRLEITIAAAIHNQRLVTAAEKVPKLLVPSIMPSRVGAQQPFHAGHQVGLRRFHHQMKIIVHQAIGMRLPARLATGFSERFQKSPPINVILKNILPPVTPVHHMINRARVFDSQLPRHAQKLAAPPEPSIYITISWTDPSTMQGLMTQSVKIRYGQRCENK